MRRNLTSSERISSRHDINNLLNNKKKYYSRCLGIKAVANLSDVTRLLVCGRNTRGMNAVDRNKLKRLGRELFRNNKSLSPPGYDICLFVAPRALQITHSALECEYRGLLLKLTSIKNGKKNNSCGSTINSNNC